MEGRVEMDHLDRLESESVYIIREAYSKYDKLGMLWSAGKDSTTLSYLVRKAFLGKVPIPAIYIDTGFHFQEMYDFRDKLAEDWGLNLVIAKSEEADEKEITPEDKLKCCGMRKTQALKDTIAEHGFDALLVGIRRDEHGIRAKERFVSARDQDFRWDYKNQPPELWDQYKSQREVGQHLRVHPLLSWAECVPKGHYVLGNSTRDISEMLVGDKVLGHDGGYHEITRTFEREYHGDLVEITPWNSLPIRVTEEHPILTARSSQCFMKEGVVCKPTCHRSEDCKRIGEKSKEVMEKYNSALKLRRNGHTLSEIGSELGFSETAVLKWCRGSKPRYSNDKIPFFENYEMEWIPAKNVHEKDFVLLPILKKEKDLDNIKLEKGKLHITPGILRLCGYYVAEGSINYNIYNDNKVPSTLKFAFGSHEKEYIDDVVDIGKEIGLNSHQVRKGTSTDILLYSSSLAKSFKKWFGVKAFHKRVPRWLLLLPENKVKHFLRGLIRGDGCVREEKSRWRFEYSTASPVLALQLFHLFAKFGVVPALNKQRQTGTWEGASRYMLQISDSYAPQIGEIMGYPLQRKASLNMSPRAFIYGDFIWFPVRKVEKVPFQGKVYNLEVEGANSYCCNHLAVHNCDVWKYIKREDLPVNPLYFAKERNGKMTRFRSLGCEPCTKPVESNVKNVDDMIKEIEESEVSERSGRAQDKEEAHAMQKLRALGYM
ncbi:hypothetical protein AKJ47_00190 [candidate division MSBL1 archaeon SCGC-AAA261G05]|uniref:DOD-type homing endonuclease domain-containing protein n=1 Tax=candidate division MSBL1 archaeon SCGC-AAA261G05 TaxID=1698276 RepID=A0A133VCW9_9EURY|nr:hypothetical protein AKJ47_00190 [candidate division MSBL1 archaeon SCGC-AAA261G05]